MRVMNLHLYQSIPYLISAENPENAIDFYSPEKTLKYLHSQICSFAGSSYSCQEAAIFGNWIPEDSTVSVEKCTAGFSLAPDSNYTIPELFSEKMLHSGNYAFAQFNDSSAKGIKKAVNTVSHHIISHHLHPASDRIMLRMVHETGGMLTEDLENFAFQVCIELS